MRKMTLKAAAELAAASYDPENAAATRGRIRVTHDKDDVQAYLLDDGVLLIPGSNSLADYTKYNLRMLRLFRQKTQVHIPGTEPGASGAIWHQGFLAHARSIYDRFNDRRPEFIIGHSLGGASAQILSMSWDVPAVAFAAPRPLRSAVPVPNEGKCLTVCDSRDWVTDLPPGRFRHLRLAQRLNLSGGYAFQHPMKHYKMLIDPGVRARVLPMVWPVIG
ncbi:hypothetical protein AADZ90_005690 [Aestuariibius sp. 2305UL40-4]|uniref:hypothetical protein n=1 Tax=Aestuariibius violaceus TaxID=3234132 RepID=UPI00345F10F0